jgi:hypothetical protein
MPNSPVSIRQAIIDALPVDTSYSGAAPPPEHLYIPPAHLKALSVESQLVIGTRGVGKSVWTAALADVELRKQLGASIPQLERAEIRVGFAERQNLSVYPDADTFAQLLDQGGEAYTVWRAIAARWSADLLGEAIPRNSWRETVHWVARNPETVARLMQSASEKLDDEGRYGLLLFDALDRLSNSWQVMDTIVRDLLRVALWLKPYRRLSAKLFLREDQLERIIDFPDASKLLATKAELTWARHDLHGLLWQYLLNAQDGAGECLRTVYSSTVRADPINFNGKWIPADAVKRETTSQRALFEALAGPWMGRDRRRGVPYVWTVGHLADGQGRTSPRSFLAAIRQAAEDSLERYPDHPHALHYESIKRGVQKASEIRVSELTEDYPWVRSLMRPLSGLTVPIDFEGIINKWEEAFPKGPQQTIVSDSLPPEHVDLGWSGVRDDLLQLGVFEQRKDGRVDMPDLYRVGFGRRGGVKPKR